MSNETQVIAFRGDSRNAPENTIAALESALKEGADIVHLDIQGAKDGTPMVIADIKLDRTTNVSGRVNQMTAKELQALDAGSWFDAKFKGEKIPTLDEALKAVGKKKVRLLLNIPSLYGEDKLAANLAAALKGRKGDLLMFGESGSLKDLREKCPGHDCILALDEKVKGWVLVEKAANLKLQVIRPYKSQVDADLLRKARAKNQQVFVFFADEEDDMRELLVERVDGIFTGRPGKLKALVKETKAGAKA